VTGDGRTAIVEIARASGLALLTSEERNPARTTSRGSGILAREAILAGHRRILVCLGGSATNDGGTGFLSALGFRFLDAGGQELEPGGAALSKLVSIDLSEVLPAVRETNFMVACDVQNRLLGPEGATYTYAGQKGAAHGDLSVLEEAMQTFARRAGEACGRPIDLIPGGGAAGGLGAGLIGFLGAEMRPGALLIAEAIDLERKIQGSDLVITGEGRLDSQTPNGKVVATVAEFALRHGKPAIAIAGSLGHGYEVLYERGLAAAYSIVDGVMTLREAIEQAAPLLRATGARLGRTLLLAERLRVGAAVRARREVENG
jgi:glycerate kinase